MIFQEPMTEPQSGIHDRQPDRGVGARARQGSRRRQAWARAVELLDLVGIPDAAQRVNEYPHNFSGGMRQRAMIAMALACDPTILVADEPTTALDVTIQAQILDLLRKLQQELGMAIVFVTHDLGVVADVCDHVAVLYAGQTVEQATGRRALRPSEPSVHGRSDGVHASGGSARRASPRHPGDGAPARAHARRLPVPPALRVRGGEVHRGRRPLRRPRHRGRPCAVCATRSWRWLPRRSTSPGTATPSGTRHGSHCSAVSGLRQEFPIRKGILRRTVGHVKAVDGVSFDIAAGRDPRARGRESDRGSPRPAGPCSD